MNVADSDLMASLLDHDGWQSTGQLEEADLIIINTCSVRARPEQKVLSLLGELRPWKQERAGRVLAVAGCMAQRAASELLRRNPHLDIVMGTRAFHQLPEFVTHARAGVRPVVALDLDEDPSQLLNEQVRASGPAPLRAFVPIIRGCSNFCSYCIVPYVRGPETSRSPNEILQEVAALVARGAREVTFLGQNVLAYGKDRNEPEAFIELLHATSAIDGLWRIRYLTCHPRDVSDGLITAMRDLPKVCNHIHLPLQAGTDSLLTAMGRGYTLTHYLRVLEELRGKVSGLALTTDLMVGFPGETEAEFEESLRLYERLRFDAAFTFAFSPRPGTKAATADHQVPRRVSIARLERVIELQNRISLELNQAAVGEIREVLVDGPAERGEGLLAGRARDNKQVIFPGAVDLIGTLVLIRLIEAHLWGFTGELVG
jgi:tRNA-2-methylthio-N6-dimethylallyladenosine synthase